MGSKLLLNTNRNMYTFVRAFEIEVTDSLNAAKMAKSSLVKLVMTPAPCRVVECIISIRPTYSCARALTVLTYSILTQLARAYKTGNIFETVEDRTKVTNNDLYKAVHGFSIAAKMYV